MRGHLARCRLLAQESQCVRCTMLNQFPPTRSHINATSVRHAGQYRVRSTTSYRLLLLLLISTVMSCGKDEKSVVVPVRGEVFLGEQPASGAVVVLHPRNDGVAVTWTRGYPHGIVGQDGTFEITAPPFGDGAPEGEYVVAITWPESVPNADPGDAEPEMVDRLQGRWANPIDSPVTAVVKAPEVRLPRIDLR